MGFRRGKLADLVSATGWRLLLAGCLVAGLERVLSARHFATALVLGVALALTLFDIWRSFPRLQTPVATGSPHLPSDASLLERALALLDAVTVALFVLDPDGRVRFANRAGRALAGFDIGRLQDMPMLDEVSAATILSLPIGGRQLVSLADRRSMLIWVGSLSTPGSGPHRLISMQAVAGELDAVQVDAWHMMTRVLAHEMMNSLTPIASLSESLSGIIATREPDPRIADAVATIARRSQHLMRFVARYRAVADLPQPELAHVDLAAFLADVDRLIGEELRQRGIDFAVDPVERDQTVSADAVLLEQAVLNLIKNASEAVSMITEPRIRVTCARWREFIRISVCDNGIGIGDDQLEEIFVPFFTTKPDGAGIGLALARQVALAHGGRLSARRTNDRGIAFDLMLLGHIQ